VVGGSFVDAAGGVASNGCCRTTTYEDLPAKGVSNILWLSTFP